MSISFLTDMRDLPGNKRPPTENYEEQIKLARAADELGYKTVWVAQNHAIEDGFISAPLPVLSAFARETKSIRLGTGIIQLPLTQFRRVAEEACVVDVLSNGRLTLGVGAGQFASEFEIFGRSLGDRKKLMEEGISFIKPGLSGDPLPDGLPVSVLPVQRPIPLVTGGYNARSVERAVRLADGQFGSCHIDHEADLGRKWQDFVLPALRKYGRGPENFQLILLMTIWASDNYVDEWQEFVGPGFLQRKDKAQKWFGEQKVPQRHLAQNKAEARGLDELRSRMLIDKPSKIADRLKKLRSIYPFTELVVMKLHSIPHEHFAKFLLDFREQVAPIVFPEKRW